VDAGPLYCHGEIVASGISSRAMANGRGRSGLETFGIAGDRGAGGDVID
jgi:hypothetical protein